MPTALTKPSSAGPEKDVESDAAALVARLRELEGTLSPEYRRLARDLAVIEKILGRPAHQLVDPKSVDYHRSQESEQLAKSGKNS